MKELANQGGCDIQRDKRCGTGPFSDGAAAASELWASLSFYIDSFLGGSVIRLARHTFKNSYAVFFERSQQVRAVLSMQARWLTTQAEVKLHVGTRKVQDLLFSFAARTLGRLDDKRQVTLLGVFSAIGGEAVEWGALLSLRYWCFPPSPSHHRALAIKQAWRASWVPRDRMTHLE